MTTAAKQNDFSGMSTQEIEAILQKRKAEEREQEKKARKDYERRKDEKVMHMITVAQTINAGVVMFKNECHKEFDEQVEELKKYAGGLRKNSKGGFQLVSSDGRYKMVRSVKSLPTWDERADEAVTLINEFLEDKLKRTKHFPMIKTLLEKNKAGELSYPMVMRLHEIKDDYDDKRWVKAMQLLEESYSRQYSGYSYEFYIKNEDTGKYEMIPLNFSQL